MRKFQASQDGKKWVTIGWYKTKQQVIDQLKSMQAHGEPTREWRFRTTTVVAGNHAVARQYHSLPREPKKPIIDQLIERATRGVKITA